MISKKYAIGVDIGGSHICSAVVNLFNATLINKSLYNESVNNQAAASEIMYGWIKALKKTLDSVNMNELEGIGFAMPGPFDYDVGIARFTNEVKKYQNLYGLNVADYIRKAMHFSYDIPIRFINDASAFGIGETWGMGDTINSRAVTITLGTGFGSSFIKNGIPLIEGDDVPEKGCLWHLPYEYGIADDYFSTRWFLQKFEDMTGQSVNGVKEIAEKREKNQEVDMLFSQFGNGLANFISPWLKKFRAQRFIIGGNIAHAYPFFGPHLEYGLHSNDVQIKPEVSHLMESASIMGSARLLEHAYWSKLRLSLTKM